MSTATEMSEWTALPKEPVVSVSMIAYNNEPYIRQALDSVLLQDVDFSFEIGLGVDESADGTAQTGREYERRHPDAARMLLLCDAKSWTKRQRHSCRALRPSPAPNLETVETEGV